jgi:hypothetical protein
MGHESLQVLVRGNVWSGTVFVDPASSNELGRRGEHEGFFNLTFGSGCWLWWRRRSPSRRLPAGMPENRPS